MQGPTSTVNPDTETIQFRQETNTFSLQVQLTDAKLSLKLKDYNDWVIYSRDYSEEDIGKEIHRKVDLVDIYSAFAMTKPQGVQEKNLVKYEFGTIVKGEDMQCYKIQQKGKVTVYRNVFQKKNKEQKLLTFTSTLNLTKERDMNEMQIFICKSEMQKRELSQHFSDQIEKLSAKNEELGVKVVGLTGALEKSQKREHEMGEEIKKLTASLQKTEKKEQELSDEIKKIEGRLEKAEKKQNQLSEEIKKITTSLDKQREQRKQDTKKATDDIALIKKQEEALKNANPLALTFPRIYSIIESPYTKNFRVVGPTIEYQGTGWNQLIINDKIPFAVNYTFKVKVIKTTSRYIMVGVIDSVKQKAVSTSYSSSQSVAYYFANAYRYPNMGVQGAGVSVGETAEICVNLQGKSVKVTVAGTLRATLAHDILVDQQRSFAPYIQMNTSGDIVEVTF